MGLTQKGRGFLRLLSDDEIRKIHHGTLNILEEQGVKFLLPEARQIFADAGLEVSKEGVVRFPSYVVEDAIKKAPSRFTRYPLHPSYPEVDMGSDSLYIMPGSTPRYILDLETGKQRLATKQDVANFAKLADALPHFHMGNGGLEASDLPKKVWHAFYFEMMTKNMRKPMPAGDGLNKKISEDLVHLVSAVLGGKEEVARKKTYAMTAPPISSLTWGKNVTAFIAAAKAEIPVEIMPMPMAGSSHPVSLAGTLIQTNAEILSIVALTQFINPGTPVIYAPYPGIMDMRFANHVFGCPEAALIGATAAQLSRWYGIPNDIVTGTVDAKIPDGQAAYEKVMVTLLPALAGANSMTHFGGLIDFAGTQSLEQLVIDNEIAGNILRIIEGMDTSEDKLAIDVIKEVGVGGNFLSHPHTLKYFREEHFQVDLADRNPRSVWERLGSKTLLEKARERVKKILSDYCPPPLDKDTQKELEKAVREIYEREGVAYTPIPTEW